MNIKQNVMSYTRITHGGCLIIMASAALHTTLPWFKHNRPSDFNEDNIISKFEALPKLVESDYCPLQFNISNTKLDDHDDYNPLKIDTLTGLCK